MHVFMTGAAGYVGGVVARRLLDSGHHVIALSRSPASDARLARIGAEPWRGDLAETGTLRARAAVADAVIHLAIDYGDPGFGALDDAAVVAMLDGLGDRDVPFVYASSTLVYGDTGPTPVDEQHPAVPLVQPFKLSSERRVLAAGACGTVLRSGLVYGHDGSALLSSMRAGAREHGAVTYVGHGTNRWSVVHVDDLAALFLAVIERGPGGLFNAAAGPAPSMREIAAAVAAAEGVRAVPIDVEQAAAGLGDFADQLTRDLVVDATRAETELTWTPTGPTLLEELNRAQSPPSRA